MFGLNKKNNNIKNKKPIIKKAGKDIKDDEEVPTFVKANDKEKHPSKKMIVVPDLICKVK
jgi:hypothetical protein